MNCEKTDTTDTTLKTTKNKQQNTKQNTKDYDFATNKLSVYVISKFVEIFSNKHLYQYIRRMSYDSVIQPLCLQTIVLDYSSLRSVYTSVFRIEGR